MVEDSKDILHELQIKNMILLHLQDLVLFVQQAFICFHTHRVIQYALLGKKQSAMAFYKAFKDRYAQSPK